MKNAGEIQIFWRRSKYGICHSITKLSGKGTVFGQFSGKRKHRRSNPYIKEKLSGYETE